MGIQQVTNLATKVLQNVKKLPPRHMFLGGGAAIFAAGLLVGKAILGDSFEKEQALESHGEAYTEPAPPAQGEDATLIDGQENEKKELKRIEYTPPTGDDVKADTTGWYHNGAPGTIEYSRNGKVFELEFRESNGAYAGNAKVHNLDNLTLKEYNNAYGEHEQTVRELEDGTIITDYDGRSNWGVEYAHANPDYIKDFNNRTVTRTTEKEGLHKTEYFDAYIALERKRSETVEEWDHKKQDHVLKYEKKYNNTGLLQYTITPKYNSDGDLIKRDTVFVNK